jgi:hypothetical protein
MDQIGEMVLHNGTAAPLGFILHPPLIVREWVSCEGVRFIFKIGKDLLRALNFKIWGERGRGGLMRGLMRGLMKMIDVVIVLEPKEP